MRAALSKLGLAALSLLVSLGLMETGYRLFDPFPYVDPAEINHTTHGNLSEFDPVLGWRGVPGGETTLVTWNRRVQLRHNRAGFRDVEHDPADPRPALVFLGDSFAWGYEVERDEMLVSHVRQALPGFEVFNLAHRGYGTDQTLLTFQAWHHPGELRLVVLLFSENDVIENNASFAYGSYKPRFAFQAAELASPGPVERVPAWDGLEPPAAGESGDAGGSWLRRSHLLHDVLFRLESGGRPVHPALIQDYAPDDVELTRALLAALRDEVADRGGRLALALIPSKLEIEDFEGYDPYQPVIAALCRELDIPSLDLAPALAASWRRSYYRLGMHWTPAGHRVAADALLGWLEKARLLEASP